MLIFHSFKASGSTYVCMYVFRAHLELSRGGGQGAGNRGVEGAGNRGRGARKRGNRGWAGLKKLGQNCYQLHRKWTLTDHDDTL